MSSPRTSVCTCYLQYTMTLCQTSGFFLETMTLYSKVKFYYTAEIIASVPFDGSLVLFVFLVHFRVWKPQPIWKIKKTKSHIHWTTLFFSPLSPLFFCSKQNSIHEGHAKQRNKMFKKKTTTLKWISFFLICVTIWLMVLVSMLKGSLSFEVKCQSIEQFHSIRKNKQKQTNIS